MQLAQSLRLSKSTITENIAPLLQDGIVLETGVGSAHVTGGRRPVMLRINGDYRFIIVAELGLHEPIFVLADFCGKLLARHSVALPEDAPYAVRLRVCKNTIRQLLREGGVPPSGLGIIALSSPGANNTAEGRFVLNSEFENWSVDQLTRDLESTFGTKVFRLNDVNAAAIGEYHQGAGRAVSSMIFLSCGMGVGFGLVLGGKLYEGAGGSAGEIARSYVSKAPLRTQVEIAALVDRVRNDAPPATLALLAEHGRRKVDFPAVLWLWQQQDSFVRDCVRDIGVVLGEVTAFALSLLNCELAVFGGDYLVFESQMVPVMNQVVQREAFDPVRVVPSALRQEAGIQGLLSMAANVLLDDIARAL